MRWVNFFHIYQPPDWNEVIIRRAANESYLPLINILRQHPAVRITLNVAGALIEQLVALGLNEVVTGIRHLVERGQIELVGSAKYHPILPLLPPDEMIRQIELQDEICRQVFGRAYAPAGFFAPEMAYSGELEQILVDRGYRWIILDEICAPRPLGQLTFDNRYRSRGGLQVAFRNRAMSDYLSFAASIDQPEKAVAVLQQDQRHAGYLVTAMDGENLGHHRVGVDRLWEMLVTWPDVEALTITDYLAALTKEETIDLRPGNWSSQPGDLVQGVPFGLWNHPQNPIHQLQWRLTRLVIEAIHGAGEDPTISVARRLLDQALTSDKYWWASASPWWNVTIIIRETQRLVDVLATLTNVPPRIKNSAERLMQQVASTTELWEKTGLAKQRQATYLKDTGEIKYMGGQRV